MTRLFGVISIVSVLLAVGLGGSSGCTLSGAIAQSASESPAPLYFTIGMHIDPLGTTHQGFRGGQRGADYRDERLFKRHVEDIRAVAEIVEAHGGRMTIQAQSPFTDVIIESRNTILTDLSVRGHEIALHFHEDAHLGRNSESLPASTWCDVMKEEIGLIHQAGVNNHVRYWSGGNLYPGILEAASCAGLDVHSDWKNPHTQTTAPLLMGVNPWRPAGGTSVTGDVSAFARHDPNGKIIFLPEGNYSRTDFARVRQSMTDEEYFEFLRESMERSLEAARPDRVNVFHFTVHPGEFRGDANRPFSIIEQFLTNVVDPLVASGKVRWATFSQMADAFIEWEKTHPGVDPRSMVNSRQPTQGGQGPFFHQIYSATSSDGLTWTHYDRLLLDHASVTAAIVTPEGKIRIYFDPAKGTVKAPWLSWGPYLWADGLKPRSDGLIWECADFANNGTHPSPSGRMKVAQLLLKFFKSDTTVTPWFLKAASPVDTNPSQPPPGSQPQVLKDRVFFTTSNDGLTWGEPTLLAEKASVPDVIRMAQGVYWAYWVDFSNFTAPRTEKIGVARSTDGQTWEKLGAVQFKDLGSIVPVDPDVIELPDGRLRMYFYDITQDRGEHPIYSAISSDGLHYELEPGIRFTLERIFDPDVIKLKDGLYRMYLNNEGRIISATSVDGLSFVLDPGVRVERGGVPGSIVLHDGSVRLYGCGISAYKSADGLNFSFERQTNIRATPPAIVCDPAVTATPNGYLMVYKYNPGQWGFDRKLMGF